MRHRAAIDRHDQAGAALGEFDERLSAGAVPFEQAIRDVIVGFETERSQQFNHERSAGGTIDVIIAIDRDLLLPEDRLRYAFCGLVHVPEFGRIGQKIAQGRFGMAIDIVLCDPARHEEL